MHHKQLLLDFHKVLTDQLAHISRVTAEKVVAFVKITEEELINI